MLIIYNNIIIDTYRYKERGNIVDIEYNIKDGYVHLTVPKSKITILDKDVICN